MVGELFFVSPRLTSPSALPRVLRSALPASALVRNRRGHYFGGVTAQTGQIMVSVEILEAPVVLRDLLAGVAVGVHKTVNVHSFLTVRECVGLGTMHRCRPPRA
jgi:hypothetical protein